MISIKTDEELELMAEAGARLAHVMAELKKFSRIGVKTKEIDSEAKRLIEEAGCKPAFLGYTPGGAGKPYPASICTSVNEGVVHGLPSSYELKDGDILKLDLGLIYHGLYSDMAVTLGIGGITKADEKLISVTREALEKGISTAKSGNTLGDIGHAIETHVKANGFSVVQLLTGHGIGRELHEDPYVFNYGKPGEGKKLWPGMVLALEPMVSAGGSRVKQLKDDSFITADKSHAAHFEHTIAITEKGPKILTEI